MHCARMSRLQKHKHCCPWVGSMGHVNPSKCPPPITTLRKTLLISVGPPSRRTWSQCPAWLSACHVGPTFDGELTCRGGDLSLLNNYYFEKLQFDRFQDLRCFKDSYIRNTKNFSPKRFDFYCLINAVSFNTQASIGFPLRFQARSIHLRVIMTPQQETEQSPVPTFCHNTQYIQIPQTILHPIL